MCVSVSLAAFRHYCTDPDVSWGMEGAAHSCALFGGFAIGVHESIAANAKCQRVPCMLVLAVCLVITVDTACVVTVYTFTQTERWRERQIEGGRERERERCCEMTGLADASHLSIVRRSQVNQLLLELLAMFTRFQQRLIKRDFFTGQT